MGILRAEFTSFWNGDLPRDNIVNTVHFRDNDTDGILEGLGFLPSVAPDFNATATNWATAFKGYFDAASGFAAGRGVTCKLYDLGAAKPRPVLGEGTVAATNTRATSTAGNSDVSICASFYGTRNLPRQRGRSYLGYLTQSTAGSQQPTAAQLLSMVAYFDMLAGLQLQVPDPGTNTDVDWVVYSPTSGSAWKVTQGWIDNEWDTQRRRGLKPSSRQNHPVTQ
jgi:hypothetical protein